MFRHGGLGQKIRDLGHKIGAGLSDVVASLVGLKGEPLDER